MSDEVRADEEAALALIQQRHPGAIVNDYSSSGQRWLLIRREMIYELLQTLKEQAGFNVLIDLTVLDRLGQEPVFEVLYLLHAQETLTRLRLKVKVERDHPTLPSVSGLWSSANWLERELYDLYGIVFEGHPNLKRLLLPDDWTGHPLRKDYPLTQEPVQFIGLQHEGLPSEQIAKQGGEDAYSHPPQ